MYYICTGRYQNTIERYLKAIIYIIIDYISKVKNKSRYIYINYHNLINYYNFYKLLYFL